MMNTAPPGAFFLAIVEWEVVFTCTQYKSNKPDKKNWNVCILPMAATNETTPNTPITQGCTSPPPPELLTEPDGVVRITVGDQIGWVSSYHLVDPKVRQLKHAWLKKHKTD